MFPATGKIVAGDRAESPVVKDVGSVSLTVKMQHPQHRSGRPAAQMATF